MAATICPTVLANTTDDYREQMERLAHFAIRVHIDVADGIFAPTKTIAIDDIWWPGGMRADLHIMYKAPFEHTALLVDLQPQLVIVHAEAEGDFVQFADFAHRHGVEVGVALKHETSPDTIAPALQYVDHVLVFSGNLGHFGGQADKRLLAKVLHLKQLKPALEIGWDGGVNDQNASLLAAGGVDVLNAGGYIQHAPNPRIAYEKLEHLVGQLPVRHKRV
jgi:ribulose-phosphate 3-epimerase